LVYTTLNFFWHFGLHYFGLHYLFTLKFIAGCTDRRDNTFVHWKMYGKTLSMSK